MIEASPDGIELKLGIRCMGINIQEGWYDPNLLLLARFVTIAVHGSGSTVIPNCLYPCSALAACVCSLGHLQQWRLLQGPARKGPVLKPGLRRKMRRAGPRLRFLPVSDATKQTSAPRPVSNRPTSRWPGLSG